MSKQLQRRIAEIKAQMARAKSYGEWDLWFDLDKSLGIILTNEK